MTENIDIGGRLREARMRRGLSLRSVAQAVGVSPSLISQVETGKTHPSVSTLYGLVNHLGVSFDELMGHEPQPPATTGDARDRPRSYPATVQRARENPTLEMENGVRWERLAIGEGGTAEALPVTYQPRGSSSIEGKLMRHAGMEYGYILEGELTLQLKFDTYVLAAGDSLHFDSTRPHLYVNAGAAPARGVWFIVGRDHAREPGSTADATTSVPLSSALDVLRTMDRLQPPRGVTEV